MRCIRPFLFLLTLAVVSQSQAWGQEAELPIAEAVAEPPGAQELATVTPERRLRPLTVSVGLTDDGTLTGTLIESTEISIKTAFGEAAIPLSEVAGIRFPAADDTSTTVVMLNGDSITGATDLKFIGIETAWGSAKVNGQSIATLLFVPGLTWTATNSIGGKRWSLVEANALTAPVVGQATVQGSSSSTQRVPPVNAPFPQGPQPIQGSPRVIFGGQ